MFVGTMCFRNDQNGKALQVEVVKSETLLEDIDNIEYKTSSESSTAGIVLVKKLTAQIKAVSPTQS